MVQLPLDLPEHPRLVENLTHFARALRRAGLPVGPGRVVEAVRAVQAAGFGERADFYWTLHAVFVSRPEERAVFAQVFRLYWRDPRYLEQMMSLMLPAIRGVQEERRAAAAEKRAAEALLDGATRAPPDLPEAPAPEEVEIAVDASRTASAEERLKTLDFEQMSVAEAAAARRMLARIELPVPPLAARRLRPAVAGARPDWRAGLRLAARRGGELAAMPRRAPVPRWPALVVLCDISGSMSAYSRMVLHFVHAVTAHRPVAGAPGWARVHAFTFGTRLTNITRHMAARDADAALAAAGAEAQDWEGGTRIGEALRAFNRDWSRRVMGQGAVAVLITDGLDRGDPDLLARETARLRLSARRLIWVNPLLRWDGFAPRAQGVAAMLPEVDCLRAGHSVATIADLAREIGAGRGPGEKERLLRFR